MKITYHLELGKLLEYRSTKTKKQYDHTKKTYYFSCCFNHPNGCHIAINYDAYF